MSVLQSEQCGVSGGLDGPKTLPRLADLHCGWVRRGLLLGDWQDRNRKAYLLQWARDLKAATKCRLLITLRWAADTGKPSYWPGNLGTYQTWVGVVRDAFAGLADAWQIENEWEAPYWWAGTRLQYLDLLSAAYDVLTPAPVLCGGLASETVQRAWLVETRQVQASPTEVADLTELGEILPAAKCDAYDCHSYGDVRTAAERFGWAKDKLRRPIWCTETCAPDRRTDPWNSEAQRQQMAGRMLPELLPALVGAGAEVVMWLGLYPWADKHVTAGLLRGDGSVTPAYRAYKALIQP